MHIQAQLGVVRASAKGESELVHAFIKSASFLTLRSPDIPSEVVYLIVHHILLDTLCRIGLIWACQGSVTESMLGYVIDSYVNSGTY